MKRVRTTILSCLWEKSPAFNKSDMLSCLYWVHVRACVRVCACIRTCLETFMWLARQYFIHTQFFFLKISILFCEIEDVWCACLDIETYTQTHTHESKVGLYGVFYPYGAVMGIRIPTLKWQGSHRKLSNKREWKLRKKQNGK